ncbi:MAG: methyl-accepting chemotaxis protein, partial [Gallionella sp.]
MRSLSKFNTLTLQNQLRLMSGTSLLGMLAVIVFVMINVNQLRQEFKTYQAMQTIDKSLIEIKAGALAISRADPIPVETATQLEQTDTQIQALQQRITSLSSNSAMQLEEISKKWTAYVQGFKGAIKIASDSPADALQIPDVMYIMYLAPMIKDLDALVASNKTTELAAQESISSVMSSILWVVLLPLILMGIVTGVTQTLFGRQLRRRLDDIVSEIGHLHNGDLSHRLPECSNDEIGQMSGTINNFIARFETILHGVHSSADQTHKTAHGVSRMAHSVTQNAREQSSKVFQVSSALEGMGNTIKAIALNATNASDAARQTSSLIKSGSETGRSTIAALGKIEQ